jgi:hypothetical protein
MMNLTGIKLSISKILLAGLLIFVLIIASPSVLFGQKVREAPPPLRERIFFGGNFGLQFGSITDIQVAPIVGLWVLPRVSIAGGPEFRYYKDYYYKTNIYGGKVYTEFVLMKDLNSLVPIGIHTGIFFHLEDEFLNLESALWKNSPDLKGRFYLNTVLAGGGISQQIGARSSMNFTLLWCINPSIYTIYSNPEIRISFNF